MIVLIEAFAYLYFLGYVLNRLRTNRESRFVDAAITLSQGLLLNYFILLVLQEFSLSLAAGACLAVLGGALFLTDFRKGIFAKMTGKPWAPVLLAFVAGICFLKIFSDPLSAWDAVSIWFFHAKIMYVAKTIGISAGWRDPSLYYLVPTYPKMVTSLAAELCARLGLWNAYFPKASLFISLVPALLWVFSFFEWRASFLILVLFSVLGMGPWLWNGYMDGLVGLFGSLSMLLLCRFRSERRWEDLHAAICALGLATCIKNEGLLYAACALGVFVLFDLKSLRKMEALKAAAMMAAVLLPAIAWKALVHRYGLHDPDFDFGSSGPASKLISRLSDGNSTWLAVKSLFFVNHKVRDSFLVLTAGLAYLRLAKIRIPTYVKRSIVANLACVAAYSVGLFLVYMVSTHEQHDLIMTSVDRTTFTTVAILNVSIYLLAKEIEGRPVRWSAR